ncbi:MAG: xanthine dehydrogenase family protein subunit M [Planctomycetota bacterium]|nr:MAG: xanthine dehydrogenase family protein subunit M [Planctomycetota bacterium]
MHDFEYESPRTLAEAVAILGRGDGKPLAGGTDLIDHIRTGRFRPAVVVDLKKIPELAILVSDSHGLRVGAAVPSYKLQSSAVIRQQYTAIADAVSIIGGVQIQNRATIGGNLCTSGPAADSAPALLALGAQCVITGPQGTRTVPLEKFFTGPGKNVLQVGEVLVEITCPAPAPHSGSNYRRFIPRNEMDIAVVGVGVSVTLDASGQTVTAARIGLGAVGPTPILATEAAKFLIGQPVCDASFKTAGEVARTQTSPIDDMRGTVEFRRHVTGVLVERSLREAVARARGESQFHPHVRGSCGG